MYVIGVEVAAALVDTAESVTIVDLVMTPFQLALGKEVGGGVKKVTLQSYMYAHRIVYAIWLNLNSRIIGNHHASKINTTRPQYIYTCKCSFTHSSNLQILK